MVRKVIAAAVASLLAALGLYLILPLAADRPGLMSAALYRIAGRWSRSYDEYHMAIAAEFAGVCIIGIALFLYFRLAEPRVITLKYRPRKRGRAQKPRGGGRKGRMGNTQV